MSSQGCVDFDMGLPDSAKDKNQVVQNTKCKKRIQKCRKAKHSSKLCSGNVGKGCDSPCQKLHITRILQPLVSGTKTRKQVASCNRFVSPKSSFAYSYIQNGNSRTDPKLSNKGRVGSVVRPHRRILSHTDSQGVSKISSIPCKKSVLSVQSSTVWNSDSPVRIYKGSEGSKTHATVKGHSDPSVHRRLAAQGTVRANLQIPRSNSGQFCHKTGLEHKFQKVRIGTNSKNRLPGISFRPRSGPGLPNTKKMGHHVGSKFGSVSLPQDDPTPPNVVHRDFSVVREDCPTGKVTDETVSVASKKTLEISSVVRHRNPIPRKCQGTSGLVAKSRKCESRLFASSARTQSLIVHRRIKTGLGRSLARSDMQRGLVRARKVASHKCSGVKSSAKSNSILSKVISGGKSSSSFRQFHGGVVSEQARGYPFLGNVHNDLANHGVLQSENDSVESKAHSGLSQCDSRQPVSKGQSNSDRMVPKSDVVRENLQDLVQTPRRHVCDQIQSQTSSIHIPCPRSSSNGGRCIEHLMGGSGRLCLLSCSSSAKFDTEDAHLQVQNAGGSTRLARDELVLGSHRPVNKTPNATTSLAKSSETTIQQQVSSQSFISQSSCLASGVLSNQIGQFSDQVEKRIKAPQRPSSRRVYESRWSIFENWCKENKVVCTSPTIADIAEFLNYLFVTKDLKPSTIAGYRTAIADKLGSFGQLVGSSRELNRLIDSFKRDKPVAMRGIPRWSLSLVLLALTKPPFEPLRKADLRILTFKTLFLMCLASGKRRGEVHAWTFNSLRYRSNWSQVTVAPSPAFLSKNQLASDGPEVVKPVVIPALSPNLDSTLKEDKSLCPVRALRFYLDRTKDMRKDKHLLFISFKDGFKKDIQRATISSWLKQTILLAYESSDKENLAVSQVKAHDVRSMAASLAFKGGVPLDQILGACFWKAHNTFTSFYLKDVAWQSSQESEFSLGSVVAAQHIVNS